MARFVYLVPAFVSVIYALLSSSKRFARVALTTRTLLLVCSTVLVSSSALAQIISVGDDTSTPIEGAGHDYVKMLSETVNPANGSVGVSIQLPVTRGRGITLPFSIAYNSNGVQHLWPGVGIAKWQSNLGQFSQGGWTYTVPLVSSNSWSTTTQSPPNPPITCDWISSYVFQDPTGGRHNIGMGSAGFEQGGNQLCGQPIIGGGDQQYSSSLVTSAGRGDTDPPVIVSDADGTAYYFPNSSKTNAYGQELGVPPDYIEDRNGNKIVNAKSGFLTLTDTVGRPAIAISSLGNSGTTDTLTISGSVYKVTWTTTTPNYTVPNTEPIPPPAGTQCLGWPAVTASQTVVSSITLPNNTSYHFYYGSNPNHPAYNNPYGLLSEIDFPDGAWVLYTWVMNTTAEPAIYSSGQITSPPSPFGCQFEYGQPAVATRTVGFTQGTTAQTQTFTYSTSWSTSGGLVHWTGKTTNVSTADNIVGKTALIKYTYGSYQGGNTNPYSWTGYPATQIPVEQTVAYFDWGNTTTPIRTVNKTWQDPYDLSSEQTVLNDDGNLTSQITYTYTNQFVLAELASKAEYDYGLALLRKTLINYQAFPATAVGGTIADRPCQRITYDGSNNKVAETDYLYDASTAVCGTAAAQPTAPITVVSGTHDDTYYGPSSSYTRGNLTKATRWANTGGSPVTTYNYDETGQVVSELDPCGNGTCGDVTGTSHTTLYSYSDSYTVLSSGSNQPYTPPGNTNAYLTTITDALGHMQGFTYDYNNGQLTVKTDQNTRKTQYVYNDSLSRPTQASYPDGGLTSQVYNDTPPISMTSCRLINGASNATCSSTAPPSGWETNITTMDGMGHAVQTDLVSDPDGPTYTASTYDGFGRPYQVYNPTRCNPPTTNCQSTNETTWGVKTYAYDGLGRATQILQADGSSVATSYVGNQTTITDEAGNKRTSQTDGLGRLTDAWEAPNVSGYNYQSHYQYDSLDNLVCAVQKGTDTTAFTNCSAASATWRPRSFVYDSLSRLTSATNPESGLVTYAYDLNGNLANKVAPQPGQTGTARTTTNYTYDVLNRLLIRSYTNPYGGTISYGYDGTYPSVCNGPSAPSITSPTNLVGRRSGMCAGFSSSTWSYDSMGRALIERRANKGSITKTYQTSYAYNKDGSLSLLTYPSGDVVTYNVGGAGRTTSVKDSANNYVMPHFPCPGCATIRQQYAPFGGLTATYLGETSTTADFLEQQYDSRLKLTSIWTYGTQLFLQRAYDYHLGNGDNGDLYSITDLVDSTRSVTFAYDPLNRIKQANTTTTTGANCWGETYTLDAWGNLYARAGVTGMTGCSYESLSTTATTKNQLAILVYDAAGNVTNDGNGNLPTYDTENRISTDKGVTYYYDGDGVRIEKNSGTMYWPGPSGTLTETDLNGNINEEYVFFNGQRIARVDRPSGTVHYYFSDPLGSATLIFDASGNVQEQYYYYPYGGIQSTSGSDPNHYKFTGKERDSESGLDNFGARYNASSLGRFMTPDSLLSSGRLTNPQTWNRYAYASNNPLRIVDPTGLWDWDESAGGDMSDDDLQALAGDKHNKRHKWAQKALNFRDQFRSGLDSADEAAGSPTLSEDQQSAAQAAVNAYGSEGDGNGVTVGTQGGHGGSTVLNDNDTISVKFGSSVKGDFLTATIAHEGAHVDQADAWLNGGESAIGNLSHYGREQAAWAVGSSIAQALGMKSYAPHGGGRDLQVWNKGWAAADIETLRSKGIGNILNFMRDHSSDADMQKTYTEEHHHQN